MNRSGAAPFSRVGFDDRAVAGPEQGDAFEDVQGLAETV